MTKKKEDKPASRTMRLKGSVWNDFTKLAKKEGITRTQLFINWVEEKKAEQIWE